MKSWRLAEPAAPASRSRWLLPSAILLCACVLRVLRLGDANLWWDEALAAWAIRKGLLGVTLWTAGDVHPPLYFWALWSAVQVLGYSEFALRTLSVFAGVLCVALAFDVGRLVVGQPGGALAALLTALARFHVWWSQEARMYALAGLLGLLALDALLRWLRAVRASDHSDGLLVLWTAATIASLYTVYLMASLALVANLIVAATLLELPREQRRSVLIRWCAAQLATLAVLGAWLMLSWGRMQTWSVSQPFGVRTFVQLWTTLLVGGISTDVERYRVLWVVPTAVLVLGTLAVWFDRRMRNRPRNWLVPATLALATLLPGVLIYLATLPRGLFYVPRVEARYFAPFAVPLWVLLAWCVVLASRRWRMVGWLCGAALLAQWLVVLPGHYSARYLRDELQSLTRAIVSQAEPGDVVLLDSGGRYPLFHYYYDLLRDPEKPPVVEVNPRGDKLTVAEAEELLVPLQSRYQRLWLAEVDVHLSDPDQLVRAWLDTRSTYVQANSYGYNHLRLYDARVRPPTLNLAYVNRRLADAVPRGDGSLFGWELPVKVYALGSTCHLALLWEQLPSESVEVVLRDVGGHVFGRRHGEGSQQPRSVRQQFDFAVGEHLPAGGYELLVSPNVGPLEVVARPRVVGTTPAADGSRVSPVGVRLGSDVSLVACALSDASGRTLRDLVPGRTWILDLYWRADRNPSEDYTVFAHVLGQAHNPRTQGPVWGQHDGPPVGGTFPTSQWRAGDFVLDRHLITMDDAAPNGSYRVEVGLYTGSDGKRLPAIAADGSVIGDHVLLGDVIYVGKR